MKRDFCVQRWTRRGSRNFRFVDKRKRNDTTCTYGDDLHINIEPNDSDDESVYEILRGFRVHEIEKMCGTLREESAENVRFEFADACSVFRGISPRELLEKPLPRCFYRARGIYLFIYLSKFPNRRDDDADADAACLLEKRLARASALVSLLHAFLVFQSGETERRYG